VDFVVIGGVAAVVHGSAQITRDLDITYSDDVANLDALGAALVTLDARLRGVAERVPFVPDAAALRHTGVLRLDTVDGPLVMLAGSVGYEHLRERALEVPVNGVSIRVASMEDLLAMKRAAGRPKDLLAVEELEAIARLREG
jgi:hypothetical protein